VVCALLISFESSIRTDEIAVGDRVRVPALIILTSEQFSSMSGSWRDPQRGRLLEGDRQQGWQAHNRCG
jgi:hypothetical protein